MRKRIKGSRSVLASILTVMLFSSWVGAAHADAGATPQKATALASCSLGRTCFFSGASQTGSQVAYFENYLSSISKNASAGNNGRYQTSYLFSGTNGTGSILALPKGHEVNFAGTTWPNGARSGYYPDYLP